MSENPDPFDDWKYPDPFYFMDAVVMVAGFIFFHCFLEMLLKG